MYLGAQSACIPARLDFDLGPIQHPLWSLGVSGVAPPEDVPGGTIGIHAA